MNGWSLPSAGHSLWPSSGSALHRLPLVGNEVVAFVAGVSVGCPLPESKLVDLLIQGVIMHSLAMRLCDLGSARAGGISKKIEKLVLPRPLDLSAADLRDSNHRA